MQIIPRRQTVCFGCLHQAVHDRACPGSLHGIAEQPVLPSDRERTDRVLRQIVGDPSRCVYFLERSKKYTFVFYASILPCGFSFRKYVVSLGAYTVSVKGILSLKSIDSFLKPL